MPGMHITVPDVIRALRWKLGIPEEAEPGRSPEVWAKFTASPQNAEVLDWMSRFLALAVQQAVELQLGLEPAEAVADEEREHLAALLAAFRRWAHEDPARRSPWISRLLRERLAGATVRVNGQEPEGTDDQAGRA